MGAWRLSAVRVSPVGIACRVGLPRCAAWNRPHPKMQVGVRGAVAPQWPRVAEMVTESEEATEVAPR